MPSPWSRTENSTVFRSFCNATRSSTFDSGGLCWRALRSRFESSSEQSSCVNATVTGSSAGTSSPHLYLAQLGHGFQFSRGLADAFGQIGCWLRAGRGAGVFHAGQSQHFGHKLFKPLRVGQAALQACLIFSRECAAAIPAIAATI